MRVSYEWDVETVDPETGDILNHSHQDRLIDVPLLEADQRLVLVRTEEQGDRLWAYVDNAMLPRVFTDTLNEPTEVKVPQRFHREIARVGAKIGGF